MERRWNFGRGFLIVQVAFFHWFRIHLCVADSSLVVSSHHDRWLGVDLVRFNENLLVICKNFVYLG